VWEIGREECKNEREMTKEHRGKNSNLFCGMKEVFLLVVTHRGYEQKASSTFSSILYT
jgi:hypothetical protein